ncbi:MAG: hypothetical protein EA397_08460 [Deltaproteobacteria bacterium]|nr:MAG: hypothetical protein EA397_08460 [Deltaproteobacteria bacterium]
MIGVWILAAALAGPVEEGAEAFQQGRLDEALEIWRAPLEQGRGSPALHTNLGVAYYRSGDRPRAIAHWKMARALAPRDPDAAHNLAVVRSEVDGAPPPAGGLPFSLQLGTVGEYGVLGSLSFLVASAGAWWARIRRLTPWPWIGLSVIGLVFAWLSLSGVVALHQRPGAVVVDRPLSLRVEPDLAAPSVHVLQPGAEVQVERRRDGFVLVRTLSGERGWSPSSGLAIVGPILEMPERTE